uniref:Uncharacterized protein n=1 Tax=Tetradesmus obliquus TaxID=3088 RepID=A0A383WAB5_TETOB|eukprot:jgi/Sobl393_1/2966/SZX74568.1
MQHGPKTDAALPQMAVKRPSGGKERRKASTRNHNRKSRNRRQDQDQPPDQPPDQPDQPTEPPDQPLEQPNEPPDQPPGQPPGQPPDQPPDQDQPQARSGPTPACAAADAPAACRKPSHPQSNKQRYIRRAHLP